IPARLKTSASTVIPCPVTPRRLAADSPPSESSTPSPPTPTATGASRPLSAAYVADTPTTSASVARTLVRARPWVAARVAGSAVSGTVSASAGRSMTRSRSSRQRSSAARRSSAAARSAASARSPAVGAVSASRRSRSAVRSSASAASCAECRLKKPVLATAHLLLPPGCPGGTPVPYPEAPDANRAPLVHVFARPCPGYEQIMERGSSKHGPHLDEQMEHEVRGIVQGGSDSHAEE